MTLRTQQLLSGELALASDILGAKLMASLSEAHVSHVGFKPLLGCDDGALAGSAAQNTVSLATEHTPHTETEAMIRSFCSSSEVKRSPIPEHGPQTQKRPPSWRGRDLCDTYKGAGDAQNNCRDASVHVLFHK